jgi:hypothetical protein
LAVRKTVRRRPPPRAYPWAGGRGEGGQTEGRQWLAAAGRRAAAVLTAAADPVICGPSDYLPIYILSYVY